MIAVDPISDLPQQTQCRQATFLSLLSHPDDYRPARQVATLRSLDPGVIESQLEDDRARGLVTRSDVARPVRPGHPWTPRRCSGPQKSDGAHRPGALDWTDGQQ